MNEKLFFRAKILKGDWIFSNCIDFTLQHVSLKVFEPMCKMWVWRAIQLDTLSQFTGCVDGKGNKIFDLDIVDIDEGKGFKVIKGEYADHLFFDGNEAYYFYETELKNCRVVGNVFDNPELYNGTI